MKTPRLVRLLRQAASEAVNDGVPFMGAAISFYSMISIAPLFVIAISVAGLVFGAEAAEGEVYRQLRDLVGAEGAAAVEEMVRRSREPGTGIVATLIGTMLLAIGASWLFGALQTAFDRIWGIEPRPDRSWLGTLRDYFFSVLMVAGTGFLLLVSLLISTLVTLMTRLLSDALSLAHGVLVYVLDLLGGLVVVTVVFGALLKALSNVTLAWRDVIVGALFGGLLFAAGRFVIGEYLGRGSFASVYGAAGSLAVLLLWVYYSAQILCFGAEFTKVYVRDRGAQPRPRKGLRFVAHRSGSAVP